MGRRKLVQRPRQPSKTASDASWGEPHNSLRSLVPLGKPWSSPAEPAQIAALMRTSSVCSASASHWSSEAASQVSTREGRSASLSSRIDRLDSTAKALFSRTGRALRTHASKLSLPSSVSYDKDEDGNVGWTLSGRGADDPDFMHSLPSARRKSGTGLVGMNMLTRGRRCPQARHFGALQLQACHPHAPRPSAGPGERHHERAHLRVQRDSSGPTRRSPAQRHQSAESVATTDAAAAAATAGPRRVPGGEGRDGRPGGVSARLSTGLSGRAISTLAETVPHGRQCSFFTSHRKLLPPSFKNVTVANLAPPTHLIVECVHDAGRGGSRGTICQLSLICATNFTTSTPR